MAKRFIDTEIFKDPFVRGLEAPLKTLWIYIFCDCDGAGLWPAELDVACMRLGIEVDEETIKKAFEKKIKMLDDGLTWFIPSFIRIQYNNCIKSNNKAFNQVIPKLLKYDLVDSETLTENNKTFTVYKLKEGASQGAYQAPLEKDKEEEKEKVEEKDKEEETVKVEVWPDFEDFWDAYGKKVDRGKCLTKWDKLKYQEKLKIMEHLPDYVEATPELEYRRNPATYLNNQSWENEIITHDSRKKTGITAQQQEYLAAREDI